MRRVQEGAVLRHGVPGAHYLGHMEECFVVIAARVQGGDVHKDEYSGEYVLKDCVGECTSILCGPG